MEDCFDVIEAYLVDHANWGDPLLPPEPDCPAMLPNGDEFEKGATEWLCTAPPFVRLPETGMKEDVAY